MKILALLLLLTTTATAVQAEEPALSRRERKDRIAKLSEAHRLQFRAEAFNVANHANFAIPVTDLASANFGRILEANPPRLLQFGLKLIF